MSTEIDWSKAPEGATHRVSGFIDEWRKADGCNWLAWYEGKWLPLIKPTPSEYIPRPAEYPWSGEGLPPVGAVCECQMRGYGDVWQKVIVLAHHNGHAWVTGDDSKHCFTVPPHGKFRPIKTPEQVAAEERESTVNDMCHIAQKGSGFGVNRADMYAIYDAGYRWVAPEEK